MLLKSNVFRLVLSFSLIFSLAIAAFADTIRLKDGSIIKGRIVGFRDGQFMVQIGDGTRARQMTFFADEIDAIEFDGDPIAASRTTTTPSNNNTVLPRKTNTTTSNPTANYPRETTNNSANPQTTPINTNPVNTNTANNSAASNRPSNTTTTGNTSTPSNTTNVPVSTPSNNPPIVNTAARPKPIQLNLKVLADNTANGWTNAGWVVKKGQKIRISGTGRISLGGGNYSTPAGIGSLADSGKLMQSQATGSLIAVIGDDNNDFVFIGNSREFTAPRDGALFLGINEGNLDDNSGSFDVLIEIEPGT